MWALLLFLLAWWPVIVPVSIVAFVLLHKSGPDAFANFLGTVVILLCAVFVVTIMYVLVTGDITLGGHL